MKKSVFSLISVIVLCLCTGCSNAEKEKLIISYDDSLKGYVVSMYQVGEPRGAFGDVKAKLLLTEADGTVIDEVTIKLSNDGANAQITNITDVNWFENRVEVKLKELETSEEFTCVLNYN